MVKRLPRGLASLTTKIDMRLLPNALAAAKQEFTSEVKSLRSCRISATLRKVLAERPVTQPILGAI